MISLFEKLKNFYVNKIDECRVLKLNELGVSKSSDLSDAYFLNYRIKVHPERVLSHEKKKDYFQEVAKLIATDFAKTGGNNVTVSLENIFEDDFRLANYEVDVKLSDKVKAKPDDLSFLAYGAGFGAFGGLILSYPFFSDLGQGVELYVSNSQGDFVGGVLNSFISFTGSLFGVGAGSLGGGFLGKQFDVLKSQRDKSLNDRIYAHKLINASILSYKSNN